LIDAEKATHDVRRMCRWLGVSHSGYYAWLARPVSPRAISRMQLIAAIREIHRQSWGTYGSPRMHAELVALGYDVSLGRVERIMKDINVQGVTRRKKRYTPRTALRAVPAPDLVERRFEADDPNQLWVGDITYQWTGEGWAYIAALQDVCSRMCVGWAVGSSLHTTLILTALERAKQSRRPAPGLIAHSDQGSQYTSIVYTRALKDAGIQPSMGAVGTAYDNAMAESFLGTIKAEAFAGRRFETRAEVERTLFAYVEGFYNTRRRHTALGMQSPMNYEASLARSGAA
jgi:transposase InsO family protein